VLRIGPTRERGETPRTILVVAVDGLDWRLTSRMVDRGELPTLARLMSRGASGQMDTFVGQTYPLSPVVWTSCATGKRVEKHGITGWAAGGDGSALVEFGSSMRRSRAVWNIVSSHRQTVNVSGWLVTWPAESVRGQIAPELPLERPLEAWCPRPLRAPVAAAFAAGTAWAGQHVARVIAEKPAYGDLLEEGVYHALRTDYVNVEIAELLYRANRARLNMVYLPGTDIVSHYCWGYGPLEEGSPRARWGRDRCTGLVERYYRLVDRWIGELEEVLPHAAILVLSDHGFQCVDEGLDYSVAEDLLDVDGLLECLGFLSRTPEGVSWARTMAFRDGTDRQESAGIRLNLRGREPNGIVSLQERRAVLEALRSTLAGIRYQDGGGLFASIEVDPAPIPGHAGAPDLALVLRDGIRLDGRLTVAGSRHVVADFMRPERESGDHDREAVCILAGAPFAEGRRLVAPRILDIAPTLLHLLGIPVGRDMDGQVLTSAYADGYLAAHPVRYVESHEQERPGPGTPPGTMPREKERLLRSLGYVE